MDRTLKKINSFLPVFFLSMCALTTAPTDVFAQNADRETGQTSRRQHLGPDSNAQRSESSPPISERRRVLDQMRRNSITNATQVESVAPVDPNGTSAVPQGRRTGRMSFEERRDLRRQINEAGHDIYGNPPNR